MQYRKSWQAVTTPSNALETALLRANKPCMDNGVAFVNRERLTEAEAFLPTQGWGILGQDTLMSIFSPKAGIMPKAVISCHVDTVFQPNEHFVALEGEGFYRGQWDNAACLAALYLCIGELPKDGSVAIALTGGEETMRCNGVRQANQFLKATPPLAAIALDVSPGVPHGVSFENFSHIPRDFQGLKNCHYIRNGLPDEGYIWRSLLPNAATASLCLRITDGERMHSPAGCIISETDMADYIRVLPAFVQSMSVGRNIAPSPVI